MRGAALLMIGLALAGCGRRGDLVRQGPPPPAAVAAPVTPTVIDPERREDWTREEEPTPTPTP